MSQPPRILPADQLQSLLDRLTDAGFRCIGPQVRDGAIVYDTISNVQALPQGVSVSQRPGRYAVGNADHDMYFAWTHGPQGIKPLTFRPREQLWQVRRDGDGALHFEAVCTNTDRVAFIGARACDLAALYLQDKHFLQGDYPDPAFRAARESLFIVAVNCTHPAATCFCASTGDGPRAEYGFDIVLTELEEGFVVEALSDSGRELAARLPTLSSSAEQLDRARAAVEAAAEQRRSLPGRNLRGALFANLDHPRWEDVAARCLSCGNCTVVCPTCFCHREVETPELEGRHSQHWREWDSCFTEGHSYLHGAPVRRHADERYRQWLTHKLGSWHEQYGRSGCVGCGRCITWCPVGIDITQEAGAICGR